MSPEQVGYQLVFHHLLSIGTNPHSMVLGDSENGVGGDQSDSPRLEPLSWCLYNLSDNRYQC